METQWFPPNDQVFQNENVTITELPQNQRIELIRKKLKQIDENSWSFMAKSDPKKSIEIQSIIRNSMRHYWPIEGALFVLHANAYRISTHRNLAIALTLTPSQVGPFHCKHQLPNTMDFHIFQVDKNPSVALSFLSFSHALIGSGCLGWRALYRPTKFPVVWAQNWSEGSNNTHKVYTSHASIEHLTNCMWYATRRTHTCAPSLWALFIGHVLNSNTTFNFIFASGRVRIAAVVIKTHEHRMKTTSWNESY